VPIVFVTTIDPVGGGLVESLARPGSNATGFSTREFSMFGKSLELLKEIAPRMSRVAVIRDPAVAGGSGGFAAIQTVAPSFGVELTLSACAPPMRSNAVLWRSRAPGTAG
jgi:putative tryptophan/tyrosine transport system substrate-binding protein